MYKCFLLCVCLLYSCGLFANDGAYLMSGNQLIPINETSIEIKKEILTLKKVGENLEVTVDYTFFNPEQVSRTILVGFEAFSPQGDADLYPKNGQHPYMKNFTVNMNHRVLPYNISYVSVANHQKEISLDEIENFDSESFYYVYHFDAVFQPGINHIVHTYTFEMSGSVDYIYNFEYILTAANRWANNKIEDFTLNIDMGSFESFCINETFFDTVNEWSIIGLGHKVNDFMKEYRFSENKYAAAFFIQDGIIQFKKKDFHPKGELFLFKQRFMTEETVFNTNIELPFYIDLHVFFDEIEDKIALKVLQNLPYARRGYIFTNQELKKYYEKLPWYVPNENYVPEPKFLELSEINWLIALKNIKIKNIN